MDKQKIKERLALVVLLVLFAVIAKNLYVNIFSLERVTLLDGYQDKSKLTARKSSAPTIEASEADFLKHEGKHQSLQTEWWYLAAHLEDQKNSENKFGLTLVFHKNPPRIIFGLADGVTRKNYSALSRLDKYDVLGQENLTIVAGQNHWLRSSSGDYSIEFAHEGQAIKLRLTPQKKPFIYSLAAPSFYYQQTRLSASGQISFADGRVYDVEGLGWIDHQGFEGQLSWKSWRWYAAQLDNNIELAFVTDFYLKSGGVIEKNQLYIFDKEMAILTGEDYELEKLDFWINNKTGVIYPIKWRLDIPKKGASLIIEALFPDQTIKGTLGFYEGTCLVSGVWEDKKTTGRAQFEFMP